jgi:hypothetical protein
VTGAGFVLTSALLGSIATRNRGKLVQTFSPLAFAGIACYIWYPKLRKRLRNDVQSTEMYQKVSRRLNEKYQSLSDFWKRKRKD